MLQGQSSIDLDRFRAEAEVLRFMAQVGLAQLADILTAYRAAFELLCRCCGASLFAPGPPISPRSRAASYLSAERMWPEGRAFGTRQAQVAGSVIWITAAAVVSVIREDWTALGRAVVVPHASRRALPDT
jgi:hypothetical protein